MIYKF